jgi:pterin-4a-carbinolamine dehydratase
MRGHLLTEVMKEYFDDSPSVQIDFLPGDSGGPPIIPTSFTWEIVSDPSRLMKEYEFDDHAEMSVFLQEIITFQQQFKHYAKITCDFPKVIVEVYTHDVNDVTELDTDYAKASDQIRQDVAYYASDTEEEERYEKYLQK